MLSTAFRQQVSQLLFGLTECYELSDAILTNRRLGSTHKSFDRLQDGLRASASGIQLQFNFLRKAIGSRMDQGDIKARTAMDISVRNTQVEVRSKLFDIAYKRRDKWDSAKSPGFKELLRCCKTIEREVIDTLQSLGQRLEEKKCDDMKRTTATTYAVHSMSEKYDEPNENEEVTIRSKDLDTLLNHMKNSWVEKWFAGNILYVNKFDAAKTQWETPTGYIKQLARSSGQSSDTFSKDSRRSRFSVWDLP